jgi:predicted Zn finger-like uncharacterized protein
MSLITRCPACQTTFRVVPDQLRISEGWVRCGQCQEIFDANAALIDETPTTASESSLTSATHAPAAVDLSLEFGAIDNTSAPASAQGLPPSVDIASGNSGELSASVTPLAEKNAEPQASEQDLQPKLPHEQLVDAAREDVSFMRKMPEKSSWQRTSLRVFLSIFAVILLAGLGLQATVHERERIVALFPQAKPALVWVCQLARCAFSGLRQIESVVIDSSSLNKVRGDAYRLSLVLRNTSALDVAMPALELTLTDSRDQPVMRRVLLANEFASSDVLGGATDWSGAVSIAVRGTNGTTERFSGYRVLAFYP